MASDIYSLGCLLWVVLAGVDAVLLRALAKRPEDRYPSARALHDALRRVLSGRAPDVAGPTAVRPVVTAPAGSGRSRVVAAVVGVAALVLGAVALWAWWPDSGSGNSANPDGRSASVEVSRTSSSPTSGPTQSPSSESVTPSESAYDDKDVEHAQKSLAKALEEGGLLTKEQSQCVAENWIVAAGLDQMVAEGLFDDKPDYVDRDVSELSPEMRTTMSLATITCQ